MHAQGVVSVENVLVIVQNVVVRPMSAKCGSGKQELFQCAKRSVWQSFFDLVVKLNM